MSDIYFGRGNEFFYSEYIDFINYVFGFNGNREDFKKLLPKLYKPECKPVENSYIALDNGKIRAAVGAFDYKMNMSGVSLNCRGIGNVAVHPYDRSKGYMKKLMNMAVDDMIKDGIDLSFLGGRRQRYNYFSYEKTGVSYNFTLNNDNMRHKFGSDRSARHIFQIKKLNEQDRSLLSEIYALYAKQAFNPVRNREQLYDILVSWENDIHVFLKDGKFEGYAIGTKNINEIILKDKNNFVNAIISLYDFLGLSSVSISLPSFCPEYIEALYNICEGYYVSPAYSFSVFNYKKVVEATLRLKASYTELPEGGCTFLIHGRAGDEKFRISTRNGSISVKEDKSYEDIELDHIHAMNLLFSPYCPKRNEMSDYARLMLPLPLWIYHADGV